MFRRASELDSRHLPVGIAWGWLEWKEGNINTARQLYRRALSINSTSESVSRCLQAWGILEQRAGTCRLFRSSMNINSQSYVTWMTWASLEEDQGNSVCAEEIHALYFQQRTEIVDDASWVMVLFDVIDPAIDSLKRLIKLDQDSYTMPQDPLSNIAGENDKAIESESASQSSGGLDGNDVDSETGFDLDAFIIERLSLDPANLGVQLETPKRSSLRRIQSPKRMWKSDTSVKIIP